MPQLDKVTFLSQFFWLCIAFSGLYLILVKTFLPYLSRILKVRSIYTGQGQNDRQDDIYAPEPTGKKKAKLLNSFVLNTRGHLLGYTNRKFLNSNAKGMALSTKISESNASVIFGPALLNTLVMNAYAPNFSRLANILFINLIHRFLNWKPKVKAKAKPTVKPIKPVPVKPVPVAPKSPKDPKSPKSPKDPKSPKSPKSPKGGKKTGKAS